MKSLRVFVCIFSRLAIFRLTRIATRDHTTFMVAKWSVELELTLKSYSSGEQLLDLKTRGKIISYMNRGPGDYDLVTCY